MFEDIKDPAKESMEKTLASLSKSFSSIRTGRASAAILDGITVEYYGVATPINQVAAIKTPEATMLVVEPWDKALLKDIEKALMASDLGITPTNDGTCLRLPFPSPTEERRKELVKQCKNLSEEARVSIRNTRRDADKKLEAAKKASEITEDDLHRGQDVIQKLTDEYIGKIDEMFRKKEAEVMEI